MKLRINQDSIRLRLRRSEVTAFIETGHVEQTTHFAPWEHAYLVYGLEHEAGLSEVKVRHRPSELIIVLPGRKAALWAETGQVGIYAKVNLGEHGTLDVIVEKDFACLDLSDADNHDTFPNPQLGAVC